MNRAFLAGAAAALSVAGSAPAAMPSASTVFKGIDPVTLQSIVAAQDPAKVDIDVSDPTSPALRIQTTHGLGYTIYMDDCDNGQPNVCGSLEFRAILPAGTLNFSQINSFNENMRYTTAFLTDKGEPRLRMDRNIRGGVTADAIAVDVRIFIKLAAEYVQQSK